MIRSLAQAQEELGQYEGLFYQTIKAGLVGFRDYGPLRFRHRRRTDSSIINDLIVDQARANFSGLPGVAISDRHGSCRIGIRGHWTIRVKKLDSRLRPSNIPTQAVLDFINQIPEQPTIPGLEGPTNLDLGYQRRDTVELESSSIWLVCPDGPGLAWEWELTAVEGTGLVTPAATPAAPLPATGRVRARPSAEGDTRADDVNADDAHRA